MAPACYLSATLASPPLPIHPVVLWLSGLLPYLVFSIPAHTFQLRAFLLLAALVLLLSFWYKVMPRRLIYDVGFLVLAAAPVITRVFRRLYLSPDSKIPLDILGHLMWIRVAIVALLLFRPWNPGRFSLWPHRDEWKSGVRWYAITLLPVCAVALLLHDVQLALPAHQPLLVIAQAVGTFFGILWVVALSEELFFRGFITRALLKSGSNPAIAIAISAVLFGSAHLWFHQFPNWRRAVVATLLGIGCGAAYTQTRSVRTPMVTHALMVTTWRLFFH